jgi:hypothetical protein
MKFTSIYTNIYYSCIMHSLPTNTDKNERMLIGPCFNFKGTVSQNIKVYSMNHLLNLHNMFSASMSPN